MHDPDLSIRLAKHLFDVQMGHRVYATPFAVSCAVMLQSVIGAPSDDELKLVHNMVRAGGSLVNSSSIFDPNLEMKLSQHLFNINIARFIRDSIHAICSTRPPEDEARPPTEGLSAQAKELNLRDVMIDVTTAQEENNRILSEAGETLKNINRTLVSTQLTLFLTQNYSGRDVYFRANDRGEIPTDSGLNSLNILKLGILPDQTIAKYLRFYSIGADLIEDGQELKIKPGMRQDAQKILRNHVVGI
ncbi:hypothetical protein B0J17DRAFT_707710 [Rhizoctonia solani]|nr:hypothetical protein B0J17DRAFT_707710 [Rhizoctonia solani]